MGIYQKVCKRRANGFSFKILLVAVLVLAVLAAVLVPQYQVFKQKESLKKTLYTVALLRSFAENYYIEHHALPQTLQDLPLTYEGCTVDKWPVRMTCGNYSYRINGGENGKIPYVAASPLPDALNSDRLQGREIVYIAPLRITQESYPGLEGSSAQAYCVAPVYDKLSNRTCKSLASGPQLSSAEIWPFLKGGRNTYPTDLVYTEKQ